jgi:hypothetical protein
MRRAEFDGTKDGGRRYQTTAAVASGAKYLRGKFRQASRTPPAFDKVPQGL